jgi:hypothetical protein
LRRRVGEMKVWLLSFLTSALHEGVVALRRNRFIPGERDSRYPLTRTLDGPQSRSGRRVEKSLALTEI